MKPGVRTVEAMNPGVLSKRQELILELRDSGASLRLIGDKYGYSPEWIRQLEKRARAILGEVSKK